MDTNINESQVVTNQSDEISPKKSPNRVMGVIGVIAFIVLVITLNVTAFYFGSKKNQAKIPLKNPITIPENNSSSIPTEESNGAPANMNDVPQDVIETDSNALMGIPIQPEMAPQEIAPESPVNENIPDNTAPTP